MIEQNRITREQLNHLRDLRRAKVADLWSKGYNNTEISKLIGCSEPSVSRDISYLNQTAMDKFKNHIESRLPQDFEKTLLGLNAILKESWIMAERAANQREKHAALSLAKECYSVRLDLLTNSGAINEAIDFVKRKQEKKEEEGTNAAVTEASEDLELELEEDLKEETTAEQ
jgi:DNA-directed RNA polymerase specialized sigma24 family protein